MVVTGQELVMPNKVKFVCTDCHKIYTRAVKPWYREESLYCTHCQEPTLVEGVRVEFDDEGLEHECKRPWKVYRDGELIYKAGYYGQGTRIIMLRFFTLNDKSTGRGWEKFKVLRCMSEIKRLRENMKNGSFKDYNK